MCTPVLLPCFTRSFPRWLWLNLPVSTVLTTVPVLSSSLPPSFQPHPIALRGWARGKQLLVFSPSSRSNLTPTERSSHVVAYIPCLARPGCYHDDSWAGNVLSHHYSAHWWLSQASFSEKPLLPGALESQSLWEYRQTFRDKQIDRCSQRHTH